MLRFFNSASQKFARLAETVPREDRVNIALQELQNSFYKGLASATGRENRNAIFQADQSIKHATNLLPHKGKEIELFSDADHHRHWLKDSSMQNAFAPPKMRKRPGKK